MRIMFSIHFGDSVAHVLRTRRLAQRLKLDGHEILYVVSKSALPYIKDFIEPKNWIDNNQSYGFSRLESFDTLLVKFCELASTEHEIFCKFSPDVVIGDMGLAASVYCINTPLIKILNRFSFDIIDNCNSAFLVSQQKVIQEQIELLINTSRKIIGIADVFQFSDFLKTPIIANGAKHFIGCAAPNIVTIGAKFDMKIPSDFMPDKFVAFVSLGTGYGIDKDHILQRVLSLISNDFKKIYIHTNLELNTINHLSNIELRPMYETLPRDVGVIICHGGYGSINMGLAAGIPVCAIPFHVEHFANAKRLEALGAGFCFGQIPDDSEFAGLVESIVVNWGNLEDKLRYIGELEISKTKIDLASEDIMYRAIKDMLPI